MVIAADGTVDDAATSSLRQSLRSEADAAEFGHGTGRQAFETVWTPARYAALTRILVEVPVTWRYFVKHEIFRRVQASPAKGSDGAADVLEAYAEVAGRFTDLPKVA